MRAQVAFGQRPSEAVQRMIGMRGRDHPQAREGIGGAALRNDGRKREVCAPLGERLGRAREDRLDQLDARMRALGAEAVEALQQQPVREHDVRGDGDLGFPAGGNQPRRALDPARLVEQHARAPLQHLAGRRQHCLAAADFERLHAEQRLQLLHGVRQRRLALVQTLGRLRVTPRFDHRDERLPLLQRDPRLGH